MVSLQGVVDPSSPGSVSLATLRAPVSMAWTPYITSMLTSMLFVATLALLLLHHGDNLMQLHYGNDRITDLVGYGGSVEAALAACPMPSGPIHRTETPWLAKQTALKLELRAAQDAGVRRIMVERSIMYLCMSRVT